MNWNKYKIMLQTDFGLLLRPQRKGVALIETSEWHYPFFNCDMVRVLLSQAIEVLYEGYTPHISLKDRADGETNWDTFFLQPFDTELDKCCMGGGETYRFLDMKTSLHYDYYIHTPYFPHHYRRWCRIFQKMVRLNETTATYIDNEYQQLFQPGDKVLGVLCRATDYIGFKGLPIQPAVEIVIADAHKWMKEYGYNKIYLATECSSIHEQFEVAFPNQIITNQRTYYDAIMQEQNLDLIGKVHFDRPNDNYLKGLQYLSSMVLLSRCNALLAGNCGGSLFTLFYNNMQYEHSKIYRLGVY